MKWSIFWIKLRLQNFLQYFFPDCNVMYNISPRFLVRNKLSEAKQIAKQAQQWSQLPGSYYGGLAKEILIGVDCRCVALGTCTYYKS